MSSGSNHSNERLDTRFSTPAPELDDHRPRRAQLETAAPAAQQSNDVPTLEVQQPTPRPSISHAAEVTARLNEAIQNAPGAHTPVNARDFENAIEDDGEAENDVVSPIQQRSSKPRQYTNRVGRPINLDLRRHERSRDSSSSSSSSPANSIEAFAEPRRRARANTIDSRASTPSLRPRGYSDRHSRRPTLSQISIPGVATQRTDRDADERLSFVDDEPGKTLKIDYEELEEFVALCKQGKVHQYLSHDGDSESGTPQKVFGDMRNNGASASAPNVALNGEHFHEKPLTTLSSAATQPLRAPSIGDLLQGDATFRDLFEVADEGGVWWLDMLNPTAAELECICKAFKIHRLTKEDIETQEPREKVELFPQYYFVCFRSFNMDAAHEDFLDPIHVYIVVCADGVLSFSYTPNPHARNVRKRINKLGDFVSLGPDYICYAMIDDIVDCFAPVIRDQEHESEAIEDQVFIAREDDLSALLKKIGMCRKRVLNMMRLLGGKADVIRGFAKRCNESYDMTPRGDIGLYLGDIQDHVVTMMSNLGHVEKMLSRSHGNYLAQLNVDTIIRGNVSNKNLTKITVVATILVPLNLITGLFGMNVHVPGAGGDSLAWFFGILGAILLFVTTALVVARRLRMV
ncbi:putative metal ion transporter C27B12.12c [Cyphellophora attinorum]|uniref:Putative metal ion transporter C27B12.12c n=1 Tax=Cyphellophora attinorum TaxID=1664694 RepID=A0A0N1HB57_9EURO|nr:putative metal ion transporter C27B12.12c [Phialophora attinorum]KPI41463.1 putative metal ion transporter C27B12.12c [Phialophora attinorum]